MRSRLIIGAVMIAAVLAMHANGPRGAVYGQSAMPIVQDAFTDNQKGTLWNLYQEDATRCKVTETGGRLELTSTGASQNLFAGYVSSGWWINTEQDFAMKVDIYCDLLFGGSAEGWAYLGVTPDGQHPRDKALSVGIGSVTGAEYYHDEFKQGTVVYTSFTSREKQKVTMYISYSSIDDELYLSDTGYGRSHAWQTYSDIVWGEWYTQKLYVVLGGFAHETLMTSGHVYFDNFVVEQGLIGGKVPGSSNPPTDPTNPTDPNTVQEDIVSTVVIAPSIIRRNQASGVLTAATSLPPGISRTDVKQTELLVLTPGEIKAVSQGTRVWLNGQVIVWGSFNKADLLGAVAENGTVNVQLTGWLKDGRKFGGVCPITIQ